MVLGYEQFFASRTITYFVIEKNHPEYLHRLLIIIGTGGCSWRDIRVAEPEAQVKKVTYWLPYRLY